MTTDWSKKGRTNVPNALYARDKENGLQRSGSFRHDIPGRSFCVISRNHVHVVVLCKRLHHQISTGQVPF